MITIQTIIAAKAAYAARADAMEWESLSTLEQERLVFAEERRWRRDFLASGGSRETSPEIMRAIVGVAEDAAHAIAIWEDGLHHTGVDPVAFWAAVTDGGARPSTDFCWGASGSHWWDGCDGCGFLTDRLTAARLCQVCDGQ